MLILIVVNMKKIVCLECANDIELKKDKYELGDVLECNICGTELEVVDVKDSGDITLDIIEEEK